MVSFAIEVLKQFKSEPEEEEYGWLAYPIYKGEKVNEG